MIDLDKRAKNIADMVDDFKKNEPKIKGAILITFDHQGGVHTDYSCSSNEVAAAAMTLQAEFMRIYFGQDE